MPGNFKVTAVDSKTRARVGKLKTARGVVETPTFLPDATYGAVKHLSCRELKEIGLQMILGNIYHLGIRPGTKLIKKFGGLRKFMSWEGPILTDSGGWQVFSLVYRNKMGRVLTDGIEFKDHLTGEKHLLTPAKSIKMQLAVDADILMVLDYPISAEGDFRENKRSVTLTTKWAKMSKDFFKAQKENKNKILLAIIQGANDRQMRKESFLGLSEIGFDGYSFGGPPVDNKIIKFVAGLVPDNKIRYLMGAGPPKQVVKAIAVGWDLFDCVVPTRNARHGLAYTFNGEVKIFQQKYSLDKKPIEKNCPCLACRSYSRAYLRHLLKVGEPLGQRLMTIHNLTFYARLMALSREKIKSGKFTDLLRLADSLG